MAATLATYISLDGTTGEAMEHWRDVFGGDLQLVRYGEMPPMEDMPFTPDPNAVAHAVLTLPGGVIAGGDSMDPDTEYPVGGTAYSLLYTTDSVEEARGYIENFLAAGGTVGMPFGEAPWGDWYGQVFDRYGVMWAFSYEVSR